MDTGWELQIFAILRWIYFYFKIVSIGSKSPRKNKIRRNQLKKNWEKFRWSVHHIGTAPLYMHLWLSLPERLKSRVPRSALFLVCRCFSPLCQAPCSFTTEYLYSSLIYNTVRRIYPACIYAECCRCCCLLLLFVIVCRMTTFVADSLNLIPVPYFSSNTTYF